jgi:phospholipid/cholesterol/gamma-HCH transport system substrate-binding protein
MSSVLKEKAGEALIGLAVVALAAWFIGFAWDRTGGGVKNGAVPIAALFPNVAGIEVGSDVRIAGLKVGTVTSQVLDPASYQVKLNIALDPGVALPVDSSASIASEGILGGSFIALTPGGEEAKLKAGDVITDTQGALDLTSLIGAFVNKPAAPPEAKPEAGQ